MSQLLTEKGLAISEFEPGLAAVLGNKPGEFGAAVLAEADALGHGQIQLRDWLYCLVRSPGTWACRLFIDSVGRKPEQLIRGLEDGIDTDEEPQGPAPLKLTALTVAPAVIAALDAAERMAQQNNGEAITDALLTLALLETADKVLLDLLTKWVKEEGMSALLAQLRARVRKPPPTVPLFDEEGCLSPRAFGPSGWQFCRRMAEDASSLGTKKITTRHMLYTLLGNESGALHVGLTLRGIDVKRELHSRLSSELAHGGRKRNDTLELVRDVIFDPAIRILEAARSLAEERGAAGIGELDIARAFVSRQPGELKRLFSDNNRPDLAALGAGLDSEEEEAAAPPRRLTIKEIESKIKDRILGQDTAVDRVIPWIKRLRFGLHRDGRPASVLLFLGPTGTGKTQLAKELARYVFGDPDQMIFLEMGQFKTKESMSGLIGAPPGYVGYGDGKLTNGLRDKPECVVLFDEIEKADTQVFDTVLRFADEGVISDPAGPVRDGRRSIIVMTTNAGQQWLWGHLKGNPKARENPAALSAALFDAAMEELRQRGFRPEFLGRVDERICFLPFTLETCRRITDQVLASELKKFAERKIAIEVDENARQVLARNAFARSLEEGARGVPRTINELIITPAIDRLAEHELEDGTYGVARMVATQRGIDGIELGVEQ